MNKQTIIEIAESFGRRVRFLERGADCDVSIEHPSKMGYVAFGTLAHLAAWGEDGLWLELEGDEIEWEMGRQRLEQRDGCTVEAFEVQIGAILFEDCPQAREARRGS